MNVLGCMGNLAITLENLVVQMQVAPSPQHHQPCRQPLWGADLELSPSSACSRQQIAHSQQIERRGRQGHRGTHACQAANHRPAQATVLLQPAKGALHDPAPGQQHEAALGLGQTEECGARGNEQITGQHDLESAGQGITFHCSNQGLLGRRQDDTQQAAAIHPGDLALRKGLQVHAGAEVAAGTGEDGQAQVIAMAEEILGIDANAKGIATCGHGVIEAAKEVKITVPLVVRLQGTNADEGRKLLAESGLKLEVANDLWEAAQKIVKLTGKAA